jgi:hypothetical protein
MGVLYDYFRAPDTQAVLKLMELTDGGPVATPGSTVDAVDGKGIEPTVTLGQLVAEVRGVEWDPEALGESLVWPTEDEATDDDAAWVIVLGDDARDTLAGIEDAQIPARADWWAEIEELAMDDAEPEALVPVLTELVELARRARTADDHVYCWISL